MDPLNWLPGFTGCRIREGDTEGRTLCNAYIGSVLAWMYLVSRASLGALIHQLCNLGQVSWPVS